MKKMFVSLVIVMFLFSLSGVIAQTSGSSGDFNKFIEDLSKSRGVNSTDITSITKLNYSNLPEAINLENVDSTSLGLYEVNINGSSPIYVFTMSDVTYNGFVQPQQTQSIQYKRSYLNFGHSGKMDTSGFLQTATGIEGSIEKGYVMPRDGSITAISTNLEITKKDSNEQIEIVIYKNGVPIGFSNTIIPNEKGVLTDYDIQSENTVTFNAGDVISAYVDGSESVSWKDVITLIEISTEE